MDKTRKLISIVTPSYNEESNVVPLYKEIKKIMESMPDYDYEHIFIDNASTDTTAAKLKEIARKDKKCKVIFNSRNFGHIRSPFYGMLQAKGDAVIYIACDFQDPPQLIREFVKKWERGYLVVKAVKQSSDETKSMFFLRKLFYSLINRLSEVELTKNYTGFGLYDKRIMDILRKIDDPYPYFRGMISEIGFEQATVKFIQPTRKRGITKNNFYTLYDMGLLGITSHTKVPLRLATIIGFAMSGLSLIVSLTYLILKLIFWESFPMGIAPLLIGIFFFSSIQLFFIGILGEYIGLIHTQVKKRPLVIEKERINFD
jgi:glycosyltransferase involved in cell wall biosynthesis